MSTIGPCLLILSIHLPYCTPENVDEYLICVDKVTVLLEDSNISDVLVVKDFNAQVDGNFDTHWEAVCRGYETLFSDVTLLPEKSYGHINNGFHVDKP